MIEIRNTHPTTMMISCYLIWKVYACSDSPVCRKQWKTRCGLWTTSVKQCVAVFGWSTWYQICYNVIHVLWTESERLQYDSICTLGCEELYIIAEKNVYGQIANVLATKEPSRVRVGGSSRNPRRSCCFCNAKHPKGGVSQFVRRYLQ